jgi:hypothetical protein
MPPNKNAIKRQSFRNFTTMTVKNRGEWLTTMDDSSNIDAYPLLFYNYRGQHHGGDGIPDDASHIIVDSSLTEISESAFNGCEFLLTVHLPTGLRVIGKQAFYECISLTSIEIPSAVEKIGDLAFAHCCSLVDVKIHRGLQIIGDSSFVDCISLVEVILPEGLKGIQKGAFMGCISLTTMTIPASVQEIESHGWCNCVKLVSIDLPEGLKRIATGSFASCTSLRSVWIPSTVEVIQNIAFHNCSNLISVEIPDGLHEIGWHAFAGCSSLANIAIPATVPFVQQDTFRDCDVLKARYPNDTVTSGLRSRFHNLPIHRLCYYQAYHPTTSTIERLRQFIWLDESDTMVDEVAMTPLHLLAMSGRANYSLVQALLKLYPIELLSKKDAMGCSPLYYLSLSNSPEATVSIKTVIRELLSDRLKWLGLERWRIDIAIAIDSISTGDVSERTKQIGQTYIKVAEYERMEAISLLEQVMWKLKIDETTNGISNKDESTEIIELTSLANLHLDDVMDRQSCRISCRAEIVIANMLPFLDKIDEEAFSSWC